MNRKKNILQTIVTASYVGGVCFWKLRTGQPFRKCYVTNPSSAVKV